MYEPKATAEGVFVYVNGEKFLQVFPTEPVTNGVITIAEQAEIIAEALNKEFA